MTAPTLETLYFTAITSESRWSQSSSPLSLYIQYADVPRPDFTPKTYQTLVQGSRPAGKAMSWTIDLPENVYYIMRLTLIISGNDLWLPKYLDIHTKDTDGYCYPVVEFDNWPERRDTTWSTDPSEGSPEIQVFPLIMAS